MKLLKTFLCSIFINILLIEYTSGEHLISPDIIKDGFLATAVKNVNINDLPILSKCALDLLLLNKSNDDWAALMKDATGKTNAGLLRMNINSLGDFDECLSIDEKIGIFQRRMRGKYCVARILIPVEEKQKNAIKRNNLIESKVLNFDELQKLVFNLGICIPNSCNGSDIEDILNLMVHNNESFIKVPDHLCSTNDSTPWDAADWGALSFFILFGAITLLSTAYDVFYFIYSKECNQLLRSFSIWTNTVRLFKLNPGSLKCLNGIRTLTMLWIILSHRYLTNFMFPLTSILDVYDWSLKYQSMIIISAPVAVDTFFLLSGMLLSYIFYQQIEKKNSFNIGLFYLHRILRLTPALAAVVFFQATLYRHLGSGPLWHIFVDLLVDACQKNWWSTLLYIHNYVNPEEMCVGQTWYLAVDMQLFILSPIILYPLWKSRKYGLINLAFWMLASFTTLVTIIFINKWPAASMPLVEGAETRQNQYYYVAHMRAMPWIIGFAFGYYLYVISKREIKIHKIVVASLWLASLATMAAVIFGMKPLQDPTHKVNHWEDSVYNSFARSSWALSVAWVIFACIKGYGGPVNWFLSLGIWEILGRLTYSMFLLHLPIQYWLVSMRKIVPSFAHDFVLYEFCGDLIFTSIVSYFLVMVFESPITIIEKKLLHKPQLKTISSDRLTQNDDLVIQNAEQEKL